MQLFLPNKFNQSACAVCEIWSGSLRLKGLERGLPQGTKVGPLGFQAIINDAATDIAPKKVLKCVDDIMLAENRTHPAPSKLQEALDVFFEVDQCQQTEFESHQVSFPPNMFKTDVPSPTVLKINDTPVEYVSEAKILGIWIKDNLKLDKNITEITKRANH